jgi:YidC/Oxa1 family membrane protein insertase
MDRTAWIAVIACLALLWGWNSFVEKKYPPRPPAAGNGTASGHQPDAPLPVVPATPPTLSSGEPSPAAMVSVPEETVVLENEDLRAVFTSLGGGIKTVELKKHRVSPSNLDNIVLNKGAEEAILNASGWENGVLFAPYQVEATPSTVVFTRQLLNGLQIRREYRLEPPYVIRLVQTVTNPATQPLVLPEYRLRIGTMGPIHLHDDANYIGASWLTASNREFQKITLPSFDPTGFLGFQFSPGKTEIVSDKGPILWADVKNQFFTLILTAPDQLPALRTESRRVKLPELGGKSAPVPNGVTTQAVFPSLSLEANTSFSHTFSLYAGPKEHSVLKKLGKHEELIMDFGLLSWVIRPMLFVLKFIHDRFPIHNYGVAIILLTLLIKALFWPLQSTANRSMKKMQALAPKMKELQDKHKEDPQKLNAEMLRLYKEYGVNPAAGCLPLLVQMPIFIGFYSMLQSAVEMRNQSFLWIHDLAQPDTIFVVPGLGLDINPLPLIMTATSVLLMRMTPQASDNPQMKIMQWLPVVFLVVLYNFAAALALYWTVNNLVSMVQTYYNLRQPLPELKRLPKPKKN